jgi:dihydropyrimidine dehydrogenase (NAD+) subunit PreT
MPPERFGRHRLNRMRNIAPKLSSEQYEKNFRDINPPLTRQQALIEASRCLYCYDAPCIKACPTSIDIPTFIRKISTNNLKGAGRVILSANILGESCGRVCPVEELCEGSCVLNQSGEKPVQIGRLQRYAVDYVLDHGIRLFSQGKPNGRRVACVGSGPASLACAAELVQRGYEVEIFDRKPLPGGLNTHGIAAYKTRASDSLREVKLVEDMGVKICLGTEIGKDLTIRELEDGFDAIFIGAGLGETMELNIPGEDLAGVYGALEFIEQTKVKPFGQIDVARRVAVIGAGNTAVDVITACRRLGAAVVYMIYRRGEEAMPAFPYEQELAKKDGFIPLWNTQPVRILGVDGQVCGLECEHTQVRDGGRKGPVDAVPGTEFVIEVDMVIKATGQQAVVGFLDGISGITFAQGRVVVDPKTHQTGNPKYFAGGDCVNGGKEVVDAVAEGMAAARGINAWLRFDADGASA